MKPSATGLGPPPPVSSLVPRVLIWVGTGLALGMVATLIWFNALFYPGYGLGGLGQEQYQAALLRAAAGYAASESLTPGRLLRSQYRPLGRGQAETWGTLMLLTPKREEVYLWVYLKWSPFWQRWQRGNCLLLADPRDRIFFAEDISALGNLNKTAYTLENYWREWRRRLREVWRE